MRMQAQSNTCCTPQADLLLDCEVVCSYHHARRRWDLGDDKSLRYSLLKEFDVKAIKLESEQRWLSHEHRFVILSHEEDKTVREVGSHKIRPSVERDSSASAARHHCAAPIRTRCTLRPLIGCVRAARCGCTAWVECCCVCRLRSSAVI